MANHIISGHCFSIPKDNIDTDQIIPARFLTTTGREGLGQFCFHHWRFDDAGCEHEHHPLKGYEADRHAVLVAGHNFGCGSSREHAPWALLDFGVRAVISTGFADIFRANALKNGLLPVTADQHVVDHLHENGEQPIHIHISDGQLEIPGFGTFGFPIDPFSAYCLARGIDQIEFILSQSDRIDRHEQRAN